MEMSRWLVVRASIFLWIMSWLRRMTLGVRSVLVRGDEVLLIKHSYLPGWHLPGGGVDHGETTLDAAIREVVEETGYRPAGPGRLFGIYRNCIPPGRDHVALYLFESFEVERVFTANREVIEIGWFDRRDLPPDTSRATRVRIEEIFESGVPNGIWRD